MEDKFGFPEPCVVVVVCPFLHGFAWHSRPPRFDSSNSSIVGYQPSSFLGFLLGFL